MLVAQLNLHPEAAAVLMLLPAAIFAGIVYGLCIPIQQRRLIAWSLAIFAPAGLVAAFADWRADSVILDDWFSVGFFVYLAFCFMLGNVLVFRPGYRLFGLSLIAGPLAPFGIWALALIS